MCEARGTNLTPVGAVRAVGYEVHAHFAFGRLDGAIGLTRRNGVTLAEKLLITGVSDWIRTLREETHLEVMNEGLHAFLHGSTGRRNKLVVVDLDGASRDLV